MYSSKAVTWQSAVSDLRSRAGAAYASGDDIETKILRDLANEWEPRSEQTRRKQHKYEAAYAPSQMP